MLMDIYAAYSAEDIILNEEDYSAFVDAHTRLRGGLFSSDYGAFDGRSYDRLVTQATGESLKQVFITPETVRKMYQALCDFELADADGSLWEENTRDDVDQLRRFFKVCSERGLSLACWT